MIINIPIELDDAVLEGQVVKDYEKKVVEKISMEVRDVIAKKGGYYRNDYDEGLKHMVEIEIDKILNERLSEILDMTADIFVKKLERRKAIKEVINEG